MKNKFLFMMTVIAIILLVLVQVVTYFNLDHWQNTITTITWIYLGVAVVYTIYYAFKYFRKKKSE